VYSVDNFEEHPVLLVFPPVDNLWITLMFLKSYPHRVRCDPINHTAVGHKKTVTSLPKLGDPGRSVLAPQFIFETINIFLKLGVGLQRFGNFIVSVDDRGVVLAAKLVPDTGQ